MDLDNISTRMKKVRDDTVTEAKKLNTLRKLNTDVHDEKKKINSMYTEMGKKLYELYKDNALEDFETEFQALEASFERLDDLREQLRRARGLKLCPNCQSEISVEERFCPNCGIKLPDAEPGMEKQAEEEPAAEEKKPAGGESAAPEETPEEPPEDSVSEEEMKKS